MPKKKVGPAAGMEVIKGITVSEDPLASVPPPYLDSPSRFRIFEVGYGVGDDGDAWSCLTRGTYPKPIAQWRRLSPCTMDSGHKSVNIKRKPTLVHVLVLEAFDGPCPPGLECRHKDGNPANNRLPNLKWGTRKEQREDDRRNGVMFIIPGLVGEEHPSTKITEEVVHEIVKLWEAEGLSCTKIAERLELHRFGAGWGAVNNILRGDSWGHITGIPKGTIRTRRKHAG